MVPVIENGGASWRLFDSVSAIQNVPDKLMVIEDASALVVAQGNDEMHERRDRGRYLIRRLKKIRQWS